MGARATDFLELSTFPGMTYQTGLGPACVISGTAAPGTSVIVEIDLGGVVGVATFRHSIDGGATWLNEDQLTAGSNSVGTTGLTMTWGTSEALVLGARYSWTNVPVVLNGNASTLDPELLRLDIMDCESTASLSVLTKRSGSTARTITIIEGDKLEINISYIVSAVGINRAWAYWGDY